MSFFFFNDTATTEIYTLSLHDALPIYSLCASRAAQTTAASQMTKQACPSAGLPPRIPPNAGVGRRGEAGEQPTANSQQPTANSQQPTANSRRHHCVRLQTRGRAKRRPGQTPRMSARSEEHTSELQSPCNL